MDDQRPLIVIPDTNVLVQGRALQEQRWAELGRDRIEVVLCGPVIRELDQLKTRSGRAGKVSRLISTKVRELMGQPSKSEILSKANPCVTLRLMLSKTNQAAVREGIDLAHTDQAIINQALARLDAGDDVILLTNDNFAALAAEDLGLPVWLLPDHWLKGPEADDSAREIARRDAEIARLRAAEPIAELQLIDASGNEIERLEAVMKRYQPVSSGEVDRLVEQILSLAPKAEVKPGAATTGAPPRSGRRALDISQVSLTALGMAPVTQADIDKYDEGYRKWCEDIRERLTALHTEWNRRRAWPSAVFVASNIGSRPASDVLVEIEASGQFELSGVSPDEKDDRRIKRISWLELPLPPTPPRPLPRAVGIVSQLWEPDPFPVLREALLPISRPRRDEDSFYWRTGKTDFTRTMALECKRWRHGRDQENFTFRIWASDDPNIRGLIIGRVSASNLSEAAEKHLPVRVTFEDCDSLPIAENLVDDFRRRLSVRQR